MEYILSLRRTTDEKEVNQPIAHRCTPSATDTRPPNYPAWNVGIVHGFVGSPTCKLARQQPDPSGADGGWNWEMERRGAREEAGGNSKCTPGPVPRADAPDKIRDGSPTRILH